MELDLGCFPALIFLAIRIANLNMVTFKATMNLQIFLKRFFFSKISFEPLLCASVLRPKSCPTLAIPWAVARQSPLSKGFPGENAGAGCHSFLQGPPDPGVKPRLLCLLHWQADS